MKGFLLITLCFCCFLFDSWARAECDAQGVECTFEFDLRILEPSQGSCCEGLVCVRDEPDANEIPTCQQPTGAEFEPCSFLGDNPAGCDDDLVCTTTENGNFCLGKPTSPPTAAPTAAPTSSPTGGPTRAPSATPSSPPSLRPSASPSSEPSYSPSASPSEAPTRTPSNMPSGLPSVVPSMAPSCGASEFQDECSSTFECWLLYDAATDCSVADDGGVCFCDSQVRGCRAENPVPESTTLAIAVGAFYTAVRSVQNWLNAARIFVFGD